jgi:Caspase domain
MPLFKQGHALVIGVADYQDPGLRLKAPITVADARGVADALENPAVAAYPHRQVQLIPDAGRRATLEGVIQALEKLAGRVGPDDTAFVFFCGHGVLGEDGDYYFTTEDTALTASKRAKAGTGLSKTKLLEMLRQVQAQKLLFVINACFSGHVSPTLSASQDAMGAPPSYTLRADILGTGEGRALITASRPTQYSYFNSENVYTYFGQALIEGLSGEGMAGSGGYIGLYELYQLLYTRVRAATNNDQEPVLTILQGVGPFPVALHKGGILGALDTGKIQPNPPTDTAVQIAKPSLVKSVGRRVQTFEIQSGGNVSIDKSRKVIDFGSENRIGSVSTGDIAGGDIIKTTTISAIASTVDDPQALLRRIEQLRAELSRLTDAPAAAREDADDGLRRAWEAGQKFNKPRMLEKLESAQKVLLTAGDSPSAFRMAEAIGTVLQQAFMLKR